MACLTAVTSPVSAPREQPLLVGNEACQAVGNLCVLQDYDKASTACTLYRELQSRAGAPGANSNLQWRARMPGLYYPARGVAALSEAAPNVLATLALPPKPGSRVR